MACPPHKREVVQAFAHHPLEVVPQVSVNGKNIEGPLMVGDEDVGTVAFYEFAVLNFYFHSKEEAHGSCPPLRGIVSPVVTVKGATNDGNDAGDNGKHQQNRCSDAVMVYSVKNVHANATDSLVGAKLVKSFQLSIIGCQFFLYERSNTSHTQEA